MKTVLVTGGSGFVGRHCLAGLVERGYDVHATSRTPDHPPTAGVTWHVADLLEDGMARKLVQMIRPTHLLHFAWCTEHGAFWTSPQNLDWVAASLTLAKEFHEGGTAERLVVAGTCAEYAWESGICVEDRTRCVPSTLYGTAKHDLHRELERYFAHTHVGVAWGRLFLLYGPDEHPKRLIASVTRSLLADQPALCTHGNQVRDLLYVADAAEAFVALLDSDASGAYNIGSGRPIRLADAIQQLARRLGRPELVRLGALPARDEPDILTADVTRLSALGWSPRHSLPDGLQRTIDWWLDRQRLERR